MTENEEEKKENYFNILFMNNKVIFFSAEIFSIRYLYLVRFLALKSWRGLLSLNFLCKFWYSWFYLKLDWLDEIYLAIS